MSITCHHFFKKQDGTISDVSGPDEDHVVTMIERSQHELALQSANARIEALGAENARLRKNDSMNFKRFVEANLAKDSLKSQLEEAEKVIEFYANEAFCSEEDLGFYQPYMSDKGKRARVYLAKKKEQG
jgi:hypothetical protein